MVQAPACWNTMGAPPGPMDSRLMNTPAREAQGLRAEKAAADCNSSTAVGVRGGGTPPPNSLLRDTHYTVTQNA